MVMLEQIKRLINNRINRVLLLAQSSLPEHQFEAYRRLVLDEFGNSGLARELERLFREQHKER